MGGGGGEGGVGRLPFGHDGFLEFRVEADVSTVEATYYAFAVALYEEV